jgi:hypothetical protein
MTYHQSTAEPEPDTFLNALVKWLAHTFGLAILPFLAKWTVAPGSPRDAELCLFVLVLGASACFEGAFSHRNVLSRTMAIVAGILAAIYGAMGYAKLSSGEAFPAVGLLLWAVIVLSACYLIYKLPILWEQCC